MLQGLREKSITWEYLFSDNFMHIATYAWVPLQYMLEMIEDRVLPAEIKVGHYRVEQRCNFNKHTLLSTLRSLVCRV